MAKVYLDFVTIGGTVWSKRFEKVIAELVGHLLLYILLLYLNQVPTFSDYLSYKHK